MLKALPTQKFGRSVFCGIVFTVCWAVELPAQVQTPLQTAANDAYKQFHNGQTQTAAKSIRDLVSRTTNIKDRVFLLRDLTEICATAYEWPCALEAETEAFNYANTNPDPELKRLIPELFSYLLKALIWGQNDAEVEQYLKSGGVGSLIATNPSVAAEEHLALHAYFIRTNNVRAAENAYSAAVLSLLLIDPSNKYAISKVLVRMLEALYSAQDTVNAALLYDQIDQYLSTYLNHNGPLWAEYRSIAAQLLVALGNNQLAIPALEEATKLNERLEINSDIRMFRLSLANSYSSLVAILNNQPKVAAEIHARHPFQSQRQAILDRGEFRTAQEMYFAMSDVLVSFLNNGKVNLKWKPLFEKKAPWEEVDYLSNAFEPYRNFILGTIAISEKDPSRASALLISAAKQRMDFFESTLTKKFEGFQLPSTVDRLVITVGLSQAAQNPSPENYDLILKGGEILLRDTRHQLSDFAVLLGAQKDERSRNDARSYNLLARQKREWELQKIHELLSGTAEKNKGALLNTYTELATTTANLKQKFSRDNRYAEAMGYPTVKTLQRVLKPNEAFITYFAHASGLGRLCITSRKVIHSVYQFDPENFKRDVKLLEFALAADYAPDDSLDIQFPVEAALNIKKILFGGLDSCMVPGSHLIVALPKDVSGIPLGALLETEPPRFKSGYDLTSAQWLVKKFSFSVTISARHFLGTRKNAIAFSTQRPYLGIGDPLVGKNFKVATLKNGHNYRSIDFSGFSDLPETADEIKAVAKTLGAKSEDILLGQAATEERVRSKSLGTYNVIHFATHGLLKGDLKDLSEAALLLTPIDGADDFDDGILSASEISRLSLRARLIVLSACNTARIEANVAGQAINDLQAAFSIAGAPTLLAALWNVETNTARKLIGDFFDEFQRSPTKNVSEILATTTRKYLAQADRSHQHPRFWAPFIVFGYGGELPANQPNSESEPGDIFQAIPDSTRGEIVSASASDENELFLSMIGDWNGTKYAGIIAKMSPKGNFLWKNSSYEIGAGKILTTKGLTLSAGYISQGDTTPVARMLNENGSVRWERRFPDLRGYQFVGLTVSGDDIFMVADLLSSLDKKREIIVIKLDWSGSEIQRVKIPSLKEGLLSGGTAFVVSHKTSIVVVINSQKDGQLDIKKPNIFGLATWCQGSSSVAVHEMDRATLKINRSLSIMDFQAHALRSNNGILLLGGEGRARCDSKGSAKLISIDEKFRVKTVWTDNDLFPTTVRDVMQTKDGMRLVIRRQRPVGIRIVRPPREDFSKRWGDDDNSIYEVSVIQLDGAGHSTVKYNSTFGLSAFVQGQLTMGNKNILYGSVASRPAISVH